MNVSILPVKACIPRFRRAIVVGFVFTLLPMLH